MARLAALALAVAGLILCPSTVAGAQEQSPPPESEEGCRPGELCGTGDVPDPSQDIRREAPDPPGNHVRSLITLGLISAVIGTYLFVALSGRNPFRRLSSSRRT